MNGEFFEERCTFDMNRWMDEQYMYSTEYNRKKRLVSTKWRLSEYDYYNIMSDWCFKVPVNKAT